MEALMWIEAWIVLRRRVWEGERVWEEEEGDETDWRAVKREEDWDSRRANSDSLDIAAVFIHV